MKNTVKASLLLCLVMLVCALTFTACDENIESHQHTFGDTWAYDEQYHWHECDNETCTEVADKAEHQWVDKGVTTEPTAESDGVSEKECSVCKAKSSQTVSFNGVSKDKWLSMLADSNFDNYTLKLEGTMTATSPNGNATSKVKETIKIADGKMHIEMFAADENSTASDSHTMLLEGELAEMQKIQNSQIFMTLLKEYESFEYDEATKTYKVPQTVSIDTVLKGISMSGDEYVSFDAPSKLEMREAEVTLSEDGKLIKFVCDYSQIMTMGEDGTTSVSGVTTWEFSDYGTTVIPAE